MCWKEKKYSKQGPLPISPAWSLITVYFAVSAPVRLNFTQVAKLTYSLILFLVRILSHLWVLAHALPAVPNAFLNLAPFRQYQYALQNLDNRGSSPKWSLLPESVPGAFSLYSLSSWTWISQSTQHTRCCNSLHIRLSSPLDLRSLESRTMSNLPLQPQQPREWLSYKNIQWRFTDWITARIPVWGPENR